MISVDVELKEQIPLWPAPIQLRHTQGDVFVTLYQRPYYIEAVWKGHVSAEDIIAAGNAYLRLIRTNPCPKLLNNKKDISGDWLDANDWLEFEWLPQASKAGLQCLAHVYSTNVFSRLSAQDMLIRFSDHLNIKNFNESETAEKWLISCRVK